MKLIKYFCYTALFTVISFNSLTPVLAEEKATNTITVTGEGIESIPTTLIQINLGVEIRGQDALSVQEQIAQRTTKVVNFLQERQVDKLKTTGFQLQPQYEYRDNQRIFQGYLGVNTVSFQLPVDKIGNLLDESVKAGATRIDNIIFTATLEEITIAQQEALKKATQDAQKQAETVLKALNLNPQGITRIEINRSSFPPAGAMMRGEATNGTPIIAGEQNVGASVTLQISY